MPKIPTAQSEHVAKKIQWLLSQPGVTVTGLAEACGIKQPSVYDWRDFGRVGKRHIPLLAKLAGTTDGWWLTPDAPVPPSGDWLAGPRLDSSTPANSDSEITFSRMDVTIPQFDTGGAMGAGLILRDQPGVIQSWRVSPEWLQKNVKNATAAKNLCIVTGFGDSMRPLFNPGDPLIVDRGVTSVDFDAIYFFRVGEEGFIKRLQRIPGTGLMALSENKSYQDWVVKPEMDFEVFGRVLKIWRGEDF